MIRWTVVLRFLSFVLLGEACFLLPPLGLALAYRDAGLGPLLLSLAATALAALALRRISKPADEELHHREGLFLVAVTWLVICAFGALPFGLSAYYPSFTDAFFESVSGFTTTGATVLASVEALPPSLHLWRCFTHWVGGMGILLLGIAILPLIGVGGMELYRAEFSGARSEKLTPRIAETAKALWKIYLLFTVLEYAALRLAGMNRFESACHSFSTMGTGGFSTRNLSVEAFHSAAIEAVIIVFMLLAGINFTLHYRLLMEGKIRRVAQDSELRFYLLAGAATAAAVTLSLVFMAGMSPASAVRKALFQVASIMTTTGFSNADFELWPPFAQMILLSLMFIGGCAGSTAGGLKTSRIALLMKVVRREFYRVVNRRGVFAVQQGGVPIGETAIQGLLNLVYLAFLVNFTSALILTACGADILTAISAVAACMFNIGPGLGAVGPSEHYGHLPELAKWTLTFCMLAGRLEFYTMIALFTPAFWRK
ncbi:MAG: TrkH family potassium uptake protein [Rubrivivax sp.]|nr:TrkH family potassium uptake protein [Rubrivivax sp.]